MPSRGYSRIQADVDDAEERELRRLEGRGAGGSTGSDARLRRESGGNLQQHGERAATGEGGRPDRPSWSEVLCAACDAGETAVPLGAADGKVLAPRMVTRTACLVQKISDTQWRVPMGEAVAHFLAANGPPEIVSYNFNKVWGRHCAVSVQRHPVVPAGPRFAHHDFADILELTSLGERQLSMPEEKQPLVFTLELACSGASHGLPKKSVDPCNCARVCCGALGSACSCARKAHKGCSVRVLLTATPALVKAGKINIELRGSHVPVGEQAVPPPLNGLRVDPHLRQQLVTLALTVRRQWRM